ncbi:hypothetical protein GTW25_01595 [Aliihoeflea aestuarii]|jgi:Ca2+-binding EF-hand superfamily protein|uniref:EF-hand domain-containing protein n=1 Tax=Aliihoeflea aestuarii TaxID=453840 RepID=UPI002093198D|nr:EF-hand domain-containing protein [Aliihoeflea aestuarii]MCO6389724.1 hypothetical protein [Aliihoeflea aestuarii]
MKRTVALILIGSFAASTAAFAQAANEADKPAREGPRHQLRQEIRAGNLDQARFAEIMTERAETRFDRLDADGDGMISREEFLAAMENRVERQFARMDRNEDGRITREDRPFRGGWRGERGERTERAAPAEQSGDEAPAE